jgi:hypothetical protein
MKEYIITLISVSIFCGLIEMMSLSEGGLKKHIRLIASLCVLCVAVAPMGDLINVIKNYDVEEKTDIFEGEDAENKYYDIYVSNLGEHTAESIEENTKRLLGDEFDMEHDAFDVIVLLDLSDEKFAVEKVSVVLYPKAIFKDPHKISEYISNLLKCECEIIYK